MAPIWVYGMCNTGTFDHTPALDLNSPRSGCPASFAAWALAAPA
ncbi:MAG TPA: hypothetical protein VKD90_06650 [Gemmataceae bacterium]|nr:hypothetical protein [Gemmataceae bacterium]